MPIHFNLKRFTKNKVLNMNDTDLKLLAAPFRVLESYGEEFTKKARDIKVSIKEWDKFHQVNHKDQKRINEKEIKLAKKIDSNILELKNKITLIQELLDRLNGGEAEALRKKLMQTEDQNAQVVDV